MFFSTRVISVVAGLSLLACTAAAAAAQPVRPGSSKVAMAAAASATQSTTTSADQRVGPVSTAKSPHAKATSIVVAGLGVGLAAVIVAAVVGGKGGDPVSPD